jgi:hypothetical protein
MHVAALFEYKVHLLSLCGKQTLSLRMNSR